MKRFGRRRFDDGRPGGSRYLTGVSSERNATMRRAIPPQPWCPPRRRAVRPRPRTGTTLVEVVAVLAVLTLVTAIAVPRAARPLDAIAVHTAVDAVASACALARSVAVMRGTLAYVTVDSATRRVRVTVGADTLLDRALDGGNAAFSVVASRPKIAYGPLGMGYGAANTTVIARRGAAADTLVTSRLGRVRR